MMPEETTVAASSTSEVVEEKPCSSSAAQSSVDVAEEAKKLIGTGNRHLVMGDVVSAVSVFQEACAMLAEKYGDTADECGEAFFLCGKSLLELARMENSVLGNALEGVPEESSEEGEKPNDSKIESADNLDEKTRDELREQVYEAMSENRESQEGITKMDEEIKECTKKDGVNMDASLAGENTGASIENEASTEKSETAEQMEASNNEEKSEASVEKTETAENVEKMEESENEAKTEAVAEKTETTLENEENMDASVPNGEKTGEVVKKTETSLENEEKMEASVENGEKTEVPAENKSSENLKNEEHTAETLKEEFAEDVSSKLKDVTKEDAKQDLKEQSENEPDKPMEEDDGDAENEEDEEEEEEEDDDEADASAEDKEGEDEVGNLQLAWEMLEVAKVIYKRKESKEDQLMAAQIFLKLGEVGAESGNYSQALEDFQECLNLQLKHLPHHSRLLAETHYQLGMTFNYTAQYSQAIQHFNSSIKVIESRLTILQEAIDKTEGAEKAAEEKNELEELKQLLPEINEKVEDAKESQRTAHAASEAIHQTLGGASTSSGFVTENGGSSSTTATLVATKPAEGTASKSASDISHLVRKKRKPEDESPKKDNDAKKVKQDTTVNGSTDSASNSNGVQEKMEQEAPNSSADATE